MQTRVVTVGSLVIVGGLLLVFILAPRSPEPGETPSPASPQRPVSANKTELVSRWVSRVPARAAKPKSTDLETTTLRKAPKSLQQLLESTETLLKLSDEALADQVQQSGYAAESLLAAHQHSGDTNWLRQAAEEAPHDPRVQLQVLATDLYPDARQEWLESFKQSAPDNSLANYLAAAQYVKDGDLSSALQEIDAGNQKKEFSAYLADSMQNSEELYLLAGNDALESKAKAFMEIEFDHLPELRQMTRSLLDYYDQLRAGGQSEAADQLAIMGVELAQHLSVGDGSRTLITQLVGLAMERSFLEHLDPNRSYASLPMPVSEMLEAIDQQKVALKELGQTFEQTIAGPDEPLLLRYFDRAKIFGEYEAIQWLWRQQVNR